MAPPQKNPPPSEPEKVYVGIPKAIVPLLLTLTGALVIGAFTMIFTLFSRVASLEQMQKDNVVTVKDYLQLKFEHQQLMDERKTTMDVNRQLLDWVQQQKRQGNERNR